MMATRKEFENAYRPYIKSAMSRMGSTPEQWDEAAAILFRKEEHEAIQVLKTAYDGVLSALRDAEQKLKSAARFGAGKTVAPDYVVAHVVPAIENLGEECVLVAREMRRLFG